MVHMANSDVMETGHLPVWVIYDHPLDWPQGFVARMHVSRGGPSNRKLYFDLDNLRDIFERVGLVCIGRMPNDDVKIVESWV